MALPAVGTAQYPTPEELLSQILTDYRYSYATHGLTVNVLPGSDRYITAKLIADRVAIAIANNRISVTNASPITAVGDDLVAIAGVFGVTKRTPSSAAGYVYVLGTSGSIVALPAGFQCTAPGGQKYQVIAPATLTLTGSAVVAGTTPTVQVRAVKKGKSTNQSAKTVMTWDSSAFGALLNTCKVDPGAIDGGADEDTDDVLRARLLRKLSNPSYGGNAAQVAEWAEESTAAVETAYVYPAVRGPGSYDVAVTAAGGDRSLSAANVAIVDAYVKGRHPGFADINTTATSQQQLDVVVNLSLPLPVHAGGAGGGWKDASPWPTTADSAAGAGIPVSIASATSASITVNSTASDPPAVGRRFSLWNPTDQEFVEFEILTVGGAPGAYTVAAAVFYPSWVVAGMYPSAAATNLSSYGATLLAAMNTLGPGEKTTDTNLLPRARRHPRISTSNPSDLTEIQLGQVSAKHSEISSIAFAARYETGTTTPRTSPATPTTTANPPRILTLKHLAFRKI